MRSRAYRREVSKKKKEREIALVNSHEMRGIGIYPAWRRVGSAWFISSTHTRRAQNSHRVQWLKGQANRRVRHGALTGSGHGGYRKAFPLWWEIL